MCKAMGRERAGRVGMAGPGEASEREEAGDSLAASVQHLEAKRPKGECRQSVMQHACDTPLCARNGAG